MKTLLIFVSLTLGASQGLFARANYGMAGCGLGALVIDRNEQLPQIGAWFLNGIYGNQTFGITSGTSNCVEGRTKIVAMEQEVFVAANLTTLKKQASQGEGEHLDGLAEVFGCSGDKEKVRLLQMCKQEYRKIFTSKEPETVLHNILSVIQNDSTLQKNCTLAS